MTDTTTGLLAVLPLLGAALGASLQFFFSRSAETSKQTHALKQQAYVDYLRALASSAYAESNADKAKVRAAAADAKTRIAIYGDTAVVEALAAFEVAGANLDTPGAIARFLAVALAMRARVDVDPRSLERILVGPGRDN